MARIYTWHPFFVLRQLDEDHCSRHCGVSWCLRRWLVSPILARCSVAGRDRWIYPLCLRALCAMCFFPAQVFESILLFTSFTLFTKLNVCHFMHYTRYNLYKNSINFLEELNPRRSSPEAETLPLHQRGWWQSWLKHVSKWNNGMSLKS